MGTTAVTDRAAPSDRVADDRFRVLDAQGLTKVFGRGDGALQAVDDVDLVVHAGEVVGLLGPNGAGKTTTIKMVAGLVTPTSGEVAIGGVDLRRHRGTAVRQLGGVLEGGRNVYWAMTAWQNLVYFGRLRGLRTRELAPRAEWLLRELDLWERRHQPVGGFSRGMQQKVAIAAALVSDPALLLLDEPTIGLDVAAARTVKDWVRRLATQEGKAVVLTTHQLAVAQELSHRVAVISGGRILANRPVAELIDEFSEDRYQIQVAAAAEDLPPSTLYEVADRGGGRTTLSISNPDAVYEVLDLLAHGKVPLVSVTPVRPDLEEVFVRLVGGDR
ncbi:MAG: ATP-binding cassette domain-containing protein [Acidimicrobiales bacterium]